MFIKAFERCWLWVKVRALIRHSESFIMRCYAVARLLLVDRRCCDLFLVCCYAVAKGVVCILFKVRQLTVQAIITGLEVLFKLLVKYKI